MGNLCGKVDASDDPFDRPGRTLGESAGTRPAAASATAGQARTAPVPARVGGPPRTLGGGDTARPSAGGSAADDARRRAAAAAEARNAPKTSGKLGAQLEAQKRESRSEILKKASEAETRHREMDAAAEAASHN